MLDQWIGHGTSEITGARVLPGNVIVVKVEVSFQASVTVPGIPVNNLGTYAPMPQADGTLFGDGQEVARASNYGRCRSSHLLLSPEGELPWLQ